MAAKRIFYITSSDLTAVYCDKGQISLLGKFEQTDEGIEAFATLIKQDPDHPSAFIVDVIEEEFRIETIPHANGGDRARLMERKAATIFRAATFTSAEVIGREPTGRRDDQVLFSSLNKTDILERWLNEVRAVKMPLAGVYSVPMLTTMLIKELKIKHDNTLVLSVQNGRLLRQSFFSQGKLKLSRLTPLAPYDNDIYLKNIINEVDRNKPYLSRSQLLNFKQPLEVYILTQGEQLQTLQTGCENKNQINYHFLDLKDVTAKLGIKQKLNADECEWCFAYLLNRKLPEGNYVANKSQTYYNLFRLRQIIVAASLALVIGATFWSATDVYASRNLALHTAQIEAATLTIAEHLANEAPVPPNPPPPVMRAAVEANRLLAEHKPQPLRIITYIGAGLAQHPNLELDNLKWGTSDQANAVANEQSTESDTSVETATIKGHLKIFPGNYQAAFKQVEALQKFLSGNPDIAQVLLLGLPINTNPVSSLVGESRINGGPPVASFELEIRFKEANHEI